MGGIKGQIEVDNPNNNIYKIEGTITNLVTNEKVNFETNNILLRVS